MGKNDFEGIPSAASKKEIGVVRVLKAVLSKLFMIDTVPLTVWVKHMAANLLSKLTVKRTEKMGVNLQKAMLKAPTLIGEKFEDLKKRGFIQGNVSEHDVEQIKLSILKKNPDWIKHIETPNINQIETAVFVNPQTYSLIPQTPELTEFLLSKEEINPTLIFFATEQTEKLCQIAVERNCEIIKELPSTSKTPKVSFAAVKESGLMLQFIEAENQTPEICLAAVQQYGLALQYVKEQTPEICLAAVQQEGIALKYVKEQTLGLCFAAVEQNVEASQYVEKAHELCLVAVQQNGNVLKYAKDLTPEMCLATLSPVAQKALKQKRAKAKTKSNSITTNLDLKNV